MKGVITVLFAICLFTGYQNITSQTVHDVTITSYSPVISRVSVLSIHVCDTMVHDSVFHFLTDRLGLPVEYYPVKWNERKYAGVYAGNMYLEPCGPYANFKYAAGNFRAIFFGVNCESPRTLSSLAEDLANRHIILQQTGSIEITDTSFIKQNIYLAISTGNGSDKKQNDSLGLALAENRKNRLGIESIKEIQVGYADNQGLQKWREITKPSLINQDGIWQINEDQSIRFVKGKIRSVNAIVFKVKSLKNARAYLEDNNLLGESDKDNIGIDKTKTFGLQIYLTEK